MKNKLQSTDLMIGDWVEVIQNGEKHFAQVQMIDGYGDNAMADECICDAIYYSIDEIEERLTSKATTKPCKISWRRPASGLKILN